MKSKVLALVLACLMILSTPIFAATFSDVPTTHDRYQAIDMLSGMDIINGFPDGTFKPDEAVTRAQMAALITRMFNLGSSAVAAEPFSDVTVSYWAASDIVSAKNRGIINGFPDGTFQPEAEVTYEQAVKMIVCALNYGAAAEKSGGYPNGYIQQASKLGILKNAAHTQDKPAPRGIIAQLLYNSLDVDMLVPQINADGSVDYVKSGSGNNTVSQQFLKTETIKNVTVVRTPKVNLEPGQPAIESVNDNAMFVKKADNSYVKITVQNTSAFDYIGQQVDITYKTDAEDPEMKTLTNITRNAGVRVYENIKLSDVISLDASGIDYYTDKAKERENSLNFSGTPVVMYNERLHTNGIAAINADLVDPDGVDGVVSVYLSGTQTLVKAKSYKTYVVESTDTRNEVIKVKGNDGQSNFDISVPYKDTYLNETVMKKGNFDYSTGKAVANANTLSSYSGISKGNIIAVATNTEDTSNNYYEVLVSTSAVTGAITEYYTDDATGRPFIKVANGSTFLLSKELDRYALTSVVQPEVNAKFHIDPFGEVGYVSNIKTEDVNIGIPVSVTTGGTGFDRITQLEIYNVSTNQVDTLRFRDETSGDARIAALKDGSGELITDALFKYTLKNGQIDEFGIIDAGSDSYQYVSAKSTNAEVTDIKKISSTKITFDNGKEITYNSTSTKIILIGSHYDTDTVIPKTTTLTTNTAYTGKVYQLNLKKSGTSYNMQYVIVRPFEGLTKDSETYIVDSIGSIVPMDDVNVVTVKAYPFTGVNKAGNGSALREVVITQPVVNALNLKKGDVFTYYDIPGTTGIDIENLRCVFVLARADEIANGNYPTAGVMEASDNAYAATNAYNRDYNFFGIQNNTSNMVGPTTNSVYAYYMGIPLTYITNEAGTIRNLRIAKDDSGLPVLAGDTATIEALEADLDNGDNFYDYDLESLANIYVYDATASTADRLIQIKNKDEIKGFLEDLQTIENNADNETKHHDTMFVKVFNSNSNNTFYNLYIIKDVR
ncbi:MAG: S-layer homology domain-containing protein [Ruminococcaceae bacterium]|nr:S-layer homology domain-containing protein [Oscillospiraceae bacterium]